MKKIIFLILTFNIFYVNSFSQIIPEGWFQQNSGTMSNLNSVYFENSQVGWCVGDSGKIIKTINEGGNWFQQSSGTSNTLTDVIFPSINTGYIIGTGSLILKTTNGGTNWVIQNSNTSNPINSVSFVNDSVGFISGLNRTILKTINGGINWSLLPFPDSLNFHSIYFINSSTGWLSAEIPKTFTDTSLQIFKTTNGGANWFRQYSHQTEFLPFLELQFTDSLNGWAVIYYFAIDASGIIMTTNGGVNWSEYLLRDHGPYSLYFLNERKGWAAGNQNRISRSTNGGVNWINSSAFPASNDFYSIFFIDSLIGWTVGADGIILKTTTGGILTNFTNTESEVPDRFFLSQNYPNPFNPSTKIEYSIPSDGIVSLVLYDLSGKEMATIVSENKTAGYYTVNFYANNLSSGIYLYTLKSADFVSTKKMMLVK